MKSAVKEVDLRTVVDKVSQSEVDAAQKIVSDAFKNNPDTFILENTDRLVFDHYDEQLYKDLKAHQDKRVAEM